jgi:hypothetical protein
MNTMLRRLVTTNMTTNSIKIPPINLWNVNEVWYLCWRYPWMVR